MLRRDFLQLAGGAAAAAGSAAASAGVTIEGFYPANIVKLRDGSLITERGQRSTDGGRTWRKSDTFRPAGSKGLVRLPNGELGAWDEQGPQDAFLGNAGNHWYFRWSADEGRSWSEPVTISLPGLTMGLDGTMFATGNGRLLVTTYTQLLGSRFDKRGASWGTYRGVRVNLETEAPYPQA